MYGTLTAYLRSKDVILIFGGSTGDSKRDCGIREFSLKTSKWRKIKDIEYNYDYYVGQALVTMDEKHILLIPLLDTNSKYCDNILIFDVLKDGEYGLRESNVKIPENFKENQTQRMLVLTGSGSGDGLLVFGFIKRLVEEHKMMMPSDDIINMIAMFYDSEILHLLGTDYDMERQRTHITDHLMIAVSTILQ